MQQNNGLMFKVIKADTLAMGLTHVSKSVLIALLDHWNPSRNGSEVWPSQSRLAGMTGLNEKTIQRAVRELAELGYIKTNYEPGRCTRYQIQSDVILANYTPVTVSGVLSTGLDRESVPSAQLRTESPLTLDRESTERLKNSQERYNALRHSSKSSVFANPGALATERLKVKQEVK